MAARCRRANNGHGEQVEMLTKQERDYIKSFVGGQVLLVDALLLTCDHMERRIAELEAQLAQVHGLPEGKCR